jgi:hypothetical protein
MGGPGAGDHGGAVGVVDADTGTGGDEVLEDAVGGEEVVADEVEGSVPGEDVLEEQPGAGDMGGLEAGGVEGGLEAFEDLGGLGSRRAGGVGGRNISEQGMVQVAIREDGAEGLVVETDGFDRGAGDGEDVDSRDFGGIAGMTFEPGERCGPGWGRWGKGGEEGGMGAKGAEGFDADGEGIEVME